MSVHPHRLALGTALSACCCLSACDDPREKWTAPSLEEPSPNVQIQPAELAPAHRLVTLASAESNLDGGAPPLPRLHAREDQTLPTDPLTGTTTLGLKAEGRWLWTDIPAPPNVPAISHVAEREARKLTGLEVDLQFANAGRFSMTLRGGGFPLARGTEIRARDDLLGAALVWPGATAYRPMPPGTLRSLLSERRLDVVSLVQAVSSVKPGPPRLGMPTSVTQLDTPWGSLELVQGELTTPNNGAAPLCWLLLELVGAEPNTDSCSPNRLPLRAWFRWKDGGQLGFEITNLLPPRDLAVVELRVPPRGANFETSRYPLPSPFTLPLEALSAIRSADVPGKPPPEAPQVGLVATQYEEGLRALMIDGFPVLWIEPGRLQAVPDLRPGRYDIGWRDFLGRDVAPQKLVEVPGRITLGAPPAPPVTEHP